MPIKPTTAIPTGDDADVFARLFIYAKLTLLQREINDLFEEYLNETPNEANALLIALAKGRGILDVLANGRIPDEDALHYDCSEGTGRLIATLGQNERIDAIWDELHYASEGYRVDENGEEAPAIPINIEERCRGLFNPSDAAFSPEARPLPFPFNSAIQASSTSYPWLQPKSWKKA